jgi:hypothetical protein
MTHDPSHRLATAEEIMNCNNPFETVDTPLGTMERWRAEAMLIGTTGGMQSVLQTIRNDAAELEKKTVELDAKKHAVLSTVNRILKFMSRVDALTSRVDALEAKHKADEAAKREFEEEPLTLPPDISEYQASTPPSEIGDTTPLPGGELHAVAPKEEPSLEGDEVGDLPKELEDPPDPVPEPRGSVYPQPTAISLNKE